MCGSMRTAHLACDVEAGEGHAQGVMLHVGMVQVEALDKGYGGRHYFLGAQLLDGLAGQHMRVV